MPQHKSIKKVDPKQAMMPQKEMEAMMAQAHKGKMPDSKMSMNVKMQQKGKMGHDDKTPR